MSRVSPESKSRSHPQCARMVRMRSQSQVCIGRGRYQQIMASRTSLKLHIQVRCGLILHCCLVIILQGAKADTSRQGQEWEVAHPAWGLKMKYLLCSCLDFSEQQEEEFKIQRLGNCPALCNCRSQPGSWCSHQSWQNIEAWLAIWRCIWSIYFFGFSLINIFGYISLGFHWSIYFDIFLWVFTDQYIWICFFGFALVMQYMFLDCYMDIVDWLIRHKPDL